MIEKVRLTYPSGWSFIKNFFLLKLSLRIFAQEKVLILVQFCKTIISVIPNYNLIPFQII